mmetsp:Transcript_114046/g.303166  ORF Transcript_114046/g.303166 Transcript_114046/m.303166 type:complete len:463 (-) Transcript_114046:150-1538(-)
METFNINKCVDKEFQTKTFHEIAEASVSALEGIGPVAASIFGEGLTNQGTVRTVRDLGSWRFYRLARAFVDLKDGEEKGKREDHCEASLRAGLNKAWASKSLEEICAAPLSAFYGLSTNADGRFAKAPLHITSIEKLAECKFCKWAAAICTLAELAEDDVKVAKASKAVELAEAAKQAALEAQAQAEQVAAAAKDAMEEALKRAERAEMARAKSQQELKEEHQKEEAAEKAESEAKEKAAAVQKSLNESLEKLKKVEAEKDAAEKRRKEEEQKRRVAERRAALEAQERMGKELEARFRKIFKEIDHNGDGFLSHTELKSYVASVDPAMRLKLGIGRWQDFLAEADADGDGKVNEAEFVSHFTRTNLDPVKCYGALFDAIDCYGNGFITPGEFREYQWYKNPNLFRMLGVSNWEEFAQTVDIDGDGVIQRDEFIAHYTSNANSGKLLAFSDEVSEPAAKRLRS